MDGFEAGTYSLVWDAASDLPKGFRCDRVRVEGSVGNLYMVIDLSDGANAVQWPVLYLDTIPEGGWTDEYKTTKLVLRRIPAGMDPSCGTDAEMTMANRDDFRRIALDAVDDAVVAAEDFVDVRAPDLGDDAPGEREGGC